MFKGGIYRGNFEHLDTMLKIIGHVTAAELLYFQHFDGYGPWQHAY